MAPEQLFPVELLATIVFLSVPVRKLLMPPPEVAALLPWKVLLLTVIMPSPSLEMPPPP